MADEKKGGFHAFEQRVHQLEEEDAKAAQKSAPGTGQGGKRDVKEERKEPKEK